MIAIAFLFLVVMLSILVTRIASIALTHTGLSREAARFQARSAFTGSGFTTNESERVVNHPVRRRIVMLLMLVGNAGIVTAISSLILTFVNQGDTDSLTLKILLLTAGLAILWTLASSQLVDRYLSRLVSRALNEYTRLDVQDYSSLMQLGGDYRLIELYVEAHDWLDDKTLTEANLRDEGVIVLGIKRENGTYLGAPHGPTKIVAGDTLILYGRISALEELDMRRQTPLGDREHHEAVEQQAEIVATEASRDPASKDDT